MNSFFYRIKRGALILVLASTAFIGAGCGSGGSSNSEFGELILQTTALSAPVTSSSETTESGDSSTFTMSFASRDIPLTEQDKKDFAANLTLGERVEPSALYKGAPKSDLWFVAPQSIIVWGISNDENPGVLEVTIMDGPRSPSAKVLRKEYYALSDAANQFGKDWLAAHPQ